MRVQSILPFLFLTIVTSVFADCPLPSTLNISCATPRHQECNWQAPWYEGFFVQDHNDTKAVALLRVVWGKQSHLITNMGTTLCYYSGNNGGVIRMGQNSWGGVTEPIQSNWVWGIDDGYPVKICFKSCTFNYPS